MKEMTYTQNRELSWLRFNERVMEEAVEDTVPDFEKLKFLSIFTSNLDEFFMIRVGSIFDQTFLSQPQIDNKTGMTAEEQLEKIFAAVRPLYHKRDKIFRSVMKRMQEYGIEQVGEKDLTGADHKFLCDYFESRIYPILSPQIVNGYHPFPHLINKGIYLALTLKIGGKTAFGIIPMPPTLERVILLPGGACRFILAENVLRIYAQELFDNCKVLTKTLISVTRNADISVSDMDDEDEDYRYQMKRILKKRARLSPVRLESVGALPPDLEQFLLQKLNLKKAQLYCSDTPLEMSYVFTLQDKIPERIIRDIIFPPFEPKQSILLEQGESLLKKISEQDLFLAYPYQSMDPFLKLLREAAEDPAVVSIKITIYRLANKAALIDALRLAAENGKDVIALVELRARFDEANNINWSESLEEAGCTVIYGIENYKVHSKVCLITRMEKGKIQRITQVGTGNYNEKTAKLYTDFSLITSDETIGKDAAAYFKNMAIGNLDGHYEALLVAPREMKSAVLDLIRREARKAQNGEAGEIFLKINSLTDRQVIDALKDASQAGVKIRMIVRGICCLLPGVEGYTDNIEIISIVGRFLEHSRVFCFGSGEEMRMYLSSADLMTRNLNKRVEVACPVYDPEIRSRIMACMELMYRDNVKARMVLPNGAYQRRQEKEEKLDAQARLLWQEQESEPGVRSQGGLQPRKTDGSAPFLERFKRFFFR